MVILRLQKSVRLKSCCESRANKPKQFIYLSIKSILSEVLNLLLKARKKFFYFLINNFGAETKHLQLKL